MISIAEHIAIETEGETSPAQAAATGERLFADLATEDLRAMAMQTDPVRCNWNQWDRSMLLAFHHNRHGKFVPMES